jgi:hypothetical protein
MPTQQPLKKQIPKYIPPHASFQKQIIYSFTDNDLVEKNNESLLYRFPYSPHTFWCNFKYACLNQYGHISSNITMKIVLKTSDNSEYDIHHLTKEECLQNKWCHTKWPLPSVKLDSPNDSGLFFRIDFLNPIPNYQIKIDLQGFIDLYPDAKHYFLMDESHKYQYLFINLYHNPFLPSSKHYMEFDVILCIEEEFEQHTDNIPFPPFEGIQIQPIPIF